MLAAIEADLTPIILGLAAILTALAGLIGVYGKMLLNRVDAIGQNAQDTANTLNHREAGDPTVKVQLDNTHALAQEIKAEVFNARDHAEKAKEAAEKSASKAEEAITLTNKFTKEIKSEVEELKIFSKKTQGMIDILFGHLGIMGKRKDDPTPGMPEQSS